MNTHRRILPEVIEVCGKPPKPFWKGPVLVYRTATPNTFQTNIRNPRSMHGEMPAAEKEGGADVWS